MTTLTLRDAVEVVLEGYTLHEGARKILETAIAQEHQNQCDTCGWRRAGMVEAGLVDSQSASTNEPLRSCGSCKNFSTQSLTGGAKCVACKAFNNWEPKP